MAFIFVCALVVPPLIAQTLVSTLFEQRLRSCVHIVLALLGGPDLGQAPDNLEPDRRESTVLSVVPTT